MTSKQSKPVDPIDPEGLLEESEGEEAMESGGEELETEEMPLDEPLRVLAGKEQGDDDEPMDGNQGAGSGSTSTSGSRRSSRDRHSGRSGDLAPRGKDCCETCPPECSGKKSCVSGKKMRAGDCTTCPPGTLFCKGHTSGPTPEQLLRQENESLRLELELFRANDHGGRLRSAGSRGRSPSLPRRRLVSHARPDDRSIRVNELLGEQARVREDERRLLVSVERFRDTSAGSRSGSNSRRSSRKRGRESKADSIKRTGISLERLSIDDSVVGAKETGRPGPKTRKEVARDRALAAKEKLEDQRRVVMETSRRLELEEAELRDLREEFEEAERASPIRRDRERTEALRAQETRQEADRLRRERQVQEREAKRTWDSPAPGSGVVCYFCKKNSHYTKHCTEKRGALTRTRALVGKRVCPLCWKDHQGVCPVHGPLESFRCRVCNRLGHPAALCPQHESNLGFE